MASLATMYGCKSTCNHLTISLRLQLDCTQYTVQQCSDVEIECTIVHEVQKMLKQLLNALLIASSRLRNETQRNKTL